MATEVKILNFKRTKGKLYYINSDGDLMEITPGNKKSKRLVVRCGINKQKGYLYFLNKKGNIGKAPMRHTIKKD